MMPSTSLKATAIPVKTNAFWKVWRKASLSQRLHEVPDADESLGRPMNAFGHREVERHHERIGDQSREQDGGGPA